MNINAFEIALIDKLSKELDITENWKNGTLNSLHHISKDYVFHLGNYDETLSLISPKMYTFTNPKLTNEIYKKAKKIYDDCLQKDILQMQDQTRKKLIEEFGLETRATKLKALEIISEQMTDSEPFPIDETTEIKNVEIELKLPKKKKWWKWF